MSVVYSLALLHVCFKASMQNEELVILNFNSSSDFEISMLNTFYYCFTD